MIPTEAFGAFVGSTFQSCLEDEEQTHCTVFDMNVVHRIGAGSPSAGVANILHHTKKNAEP
jgi:hypothetical protein